MQMKTFKILMCFFALSLCACNCTEKNVGTGDKDNNVSPETAKDVTAYVTTADSKTLFKKSSFNFTDTNVLDSYNIRYDKSKLGKEIDGFGLAVTTATAYNLMKMNQEDRTKFLTEDRKSVV